MKVEFEFSNNCWYPLKNIDDYDVNKLCGWSNGMHHQNSIRCGWVPNKEAGHIDLVFYVYYQGARSIKPFCKVETGIKYIMKMYIQNDYLVFSMVQIGALVAKTVSIPYFASNKKLGYLLFPYIGGDLPARQDSNIYLEFLE